LKHANHDLGVITLSIGVAIFPDHAEDATAIVKAADVALYEAKRSGRNRVLMFERKTAPVSTEQRGRTSSIPPTTIGAR